MKLIKHALGVGALACVAVAQPVLAYMEFTYTTNPLPWHSSFLYGEPSTDEPFDYFPPAFTFSFAIDEYEPTGMPKTFVVNDIDVAIDPGFYRFTPLNLQVSSRTWGVITLNPDNSIAAWDFDLGLDELITSSSHPSARMRDTAINIFTSGGSNSCNCDLLRLRENVVTQLSGGFWWNLGSTEANYVDLNATSNWMIRSIPEPGMPILILTGFGMIGYLRRKRAGQSFYLKRLFP